MQNNVEQLLRTLEAPDPRPQLFDVVMKRITMEGVRAAKRRLVIFSVGCVGSFAAVLPAFMMMRTNMAQSGFAEFFSLLFSDMGSVALYWQNFTLTLLESLPAVSIAAFLATLFVFFGSLRFLTRDIKLLYGVH